MFPQCKCCDIFLIIRSSELESDKDIPTSTVCYPEHSSNMTQIVIMPPISAPQREAQLLAIDWTDRSIHLNVCFQVKWCWYSIYQDSGGEQESGTSGFYLYWSGECRLVIVFTRWEAGMMYWVMLECLTVPSLRNVISRQCEWSLPPLSDNLQSAGQTHTPPHFIIFADTFRPVTLLSTETQ